MKTHVVWMIWRREIKHKYGTSAPMPCPWTGSLYRYGAWEAFERWLPGHDRRGYFAVKGTFTPVKTNRGKR